MGRVRFTYPGDQLRIGIFTRAERAAFLQRVCVFFRHGRLGRQFALFALALPGRVRASSRAAQAGHRSSPPLTACALRSRPRCATVPITRRGSSAATTTASTATGSGGACLLSTRATWCRTAAWTCRALYGGAVHPGAPAGPHPARFCLPCLRAIRRRMRFPRADRARLSRPVELAVHGQPSAAGGRVDRSSSSGGGGGGGGGWRPGAGGRGGWKRWRGAAVVGGRLQVVADLTHSSLAEWARSDTLLPRPRSAGRVTGQWSVPCQCVPVCKDLCVSFASEACES